MLVTARDEAAPLLGRDQEQILLRSFLDEVAIHGQALCGGSVHGRLAGPVGSRGAQWPGE